MMHRDHIETCGTCGYSFDRRDRRAFLPTHRNIYPELQPLCPACRQISDGDEAWAIWNGCQGIFTCSIFDRRREAQAALAETCGADEKVVPVRVLLEPEDDWWLREELEREYERDDPVPPAPASGSTLRVVK